MLHGNIEVNGCIGYEGNMSIGYYLDTLDGMGDAYFCAKCVESNGKSTGRPVEPEVFAIVPLGCGVCRYDADINDYE